MATRAEAEAPPNGASETTTSKATGDEAKIKRILQTLSECKDTEVDCARYRNLVCVSFRGMAYIWTANDLVKWFGAVVEKLHMAHYYTGTEITWDAAFAAVNWPKSRAE